MSQGRFGMKCSLFECAVSCILTLCVCKSPESASICVIFSVALTLSNLAALGPDFTSDKVHALGKFAPMLTFQVIYPNPFLILVTIYI